MKVFFFLRGSVLIYINFRMVGRYLCVFFLDILDDSMTQMLQEWNIYLHSVYMCGKSKDQHSIHQAPGYDDASRLGLA